MLRLLRRLHRDHLAIFLFHGVVKASDHSVRNYTRKHLPVGTFIDVLGALQREGSPISMEEACELTRTGRPFPERSFAITFDDGFENNFSTAAPILEEFKIPATFYVTTSFVEEGRMPWIDRIEHVFENTQLIQTRLPWRKELILAKTRQEKIELLTEIRREVKLRPDLNPETLADRIMLEAGVQVACGVPALDRKMSWEQVHQLDAHPLFTIGGHSHTHAIMSYLTEADLRLEIETSLGLLRDRAGVLPRHYSYPEGQAEHVSQAVITMLKDRGVICCPTAIDGVNEPGTDPFHLRRIMVDQVCVA